jgi:cardiolipin synthase (CMP-forming)
MIPAGYVGFGLCAMVAGAYYVDNGRFAPQRGIIMENEADSRETTELSIPNIITLGRIILVPVVVWAIASNQMEIAFTVFVIAGVSDAVDGFLAKRFNMASELGALLDPLADKALLVSIYVALGIWGAMPRWIVILVVSRDIMIVSAVIVSWLFGKPVEMKPLMVSKLNTAAQVALAALILAALGFGFKPMPYDAVLMALVTVFTLVSVSLYLVEWVRHMGTIEAR